MMLSTLPLSATFCSQSIPLLADDEPFINPDSDIFRLSIGATRKMQFVNFRAGQLLDYELVFNKRSVKYPGAGAANRENASIAVTTNSFFVCM